MVVFDALYLGVAHHTAQWERPGRHGLVVGIITFTIQGVIEPNFYIKCDAGDDYISDQCRDLMIK